MADTPDSSPNAKYYDGRYGLASLVGASAAGGISLDGESLLLPDTVTGRDFDDVSSINSSVIGRPVRPTTATTTRETVSATTYSKGTKHTEESTFKKNSTASAEQSSSGGCCCCCLPLWIRRAPLWLKIVFSISVALLLLAIVLVAVGLALAMGGTSTGGTAQESARDGGFSNEFPTRTAAPVSDTTTPTSSPVTSSTSTTTTGTKPTVATTDPTAAATTPAPSTRQPTLQPSQNPSTAPTEPLDDDILVFYAMAGRFQNSIRTQALENLPRLPRRGGTSFLLHMGDWNSRRDGCPESVFEDVRDDFKESSIPVYFVMGDNEYNDCSDPRQALTYWEENLLGFESENWGTPPWEITRLPGQLENFSFRYKRTVFASLNLVDGDVIDEMEQAERLTANLNWIHELYRQHRRRHSLFILFAHGAPDGSNQDFYDLLFERIEDEYTEMRFVLVHRNGDNQAYGFEANYDENWNLDVISVLGPIWPPLQITVDARADKPDEAVSVNFEEWYDEGL